MQNYMKTIISAIKTWTAGKIKDSTADWNQNDSSADNYIKNKPDVALRSDIEVLQVDVDNAQATANEALDDAAIAQITADDALVDAATAQATAEIKSNWNENDEESVSNILHRTHYVTYTQLDESYSFYQSISSNSITLGRSIYISFKYFVDNCSIKSIYGGHVYNLNYKTIGANTTHYSYTAPTNTLVINIVLDDTTETMNVSVDGLDSGKMTETRFTYPKFTESIKQLDEKYIPNTIARISDVTTIQPDRTNNMIRPVGKDENGLLYVSNVFDGIILKDSINGYEYVGDMQNGSFVTYCKCDHIEVTQMPTKTEYIAGDTFDPTGMVITTTAQDGSTRVIENYSYPEYIMSVVDSIEIQYVECGTTYIVYIPVTVTPFDAATALVDFEYTSNDDGTYTITGWKGTLNGVASTEMVVPDNGLIIV